MNELDLVHLAPIVHHRIVSYDMNEFRAFPSTRSSVEPMLWPWSAASATDTRSALV
jgi:hypothetical protein